VNFNVLMDPRFREDDKKGRKQETFTKCGWNLALKKLFCIKCFLGSRLRGNDDERGGNDNGAARMTPERGAKLVIVSILFQD
jgi:hypothetical protein